MSGQREAGATLGSAAGSAPVRIVRGLRHYGGHERAAHHRTVEDGRAVPAEVRAERAEPVQLLRVLAPVLDPLVDDTVPSRLGRRRLGGERIGRGGLPDVGHVRLPASGHASSVDIAKVHAGRELAPKRENNRTSANTAPSVCSRTNTIVKRDEQQLTHSVYVYI